MVNVSIYVSNGSMSSPYYTFYTDAAGTQELTPPNSLYLNNTYTFYRLNDAVNHPFYISDVGYEQASTVVTLTGDGNPLSGIIHTQSIVVEFNSLDANDSLYYFCTSHSNMTGTFTLLVPPVPAAIFNKFVQFNDDVEISGNVTLNGVMTTTDKVGIGKETPSVALDVSGTIESTSDLVIHGDISGSGANLRNIPNSALVNHTISINSQSVELGNNLDIIASQWTTNGQHIHYNTGNIGIGKTDPSVALDVSGTIESTSDLVIHGDISGSGSNLRNIPNSALVNHTISINSQSVELGNNLDIIASQWTTNGQHIHYNTGNIGIGKTDPSVALDVSGTIESTSDLVIHGDISGSGSNLRNIPNSALVNQSMIINGQEVQLGTSMELVASQWVTNVNDIYYTSGNIGIQKTNPAYSLDVSGSINCSQLLVNGSEPSFGGGGGGGEGSIFVIHDDDFSESLPDYKTGINNSITENIGWVQDLTNNLTYVSGNVGIGIVEPSYNLDVSGTVNCLELLVDGVAPLFGSGGGDNILLDASYTTGSESLIDPPQTQRFDTNKFWVLDENDNISFTLNSGNVGIGTTSPTALLHLQSTEGVTLMLEADSDNTNEDDLPLIHMKQDQQLVFHTIGGTNENDFKFETGTTNGGNTNYMAFFTGGGSGPNSGTERLRISGDGNVGIGTDTPSHRLDISGNARMNQLIIGDELDSTGNVSLVIKDNGTGNGHGNATSAGGIRIVSTAAQQSGSVDLLMGVNHASKYSFLQSTEYAIAHQNLILQPVGGNVGIGTTTPTEMLSVRGSILCLGEGNGLIFERNSGTFDNDTTHRRFIMDMVDRGSGYGNTLNISYVGTSTGTATGPNYGGTPTVAMTIAQTDGKVGIGTTTPASKLHIHETTGTLASGTKGTITLSNGSADGTNGGNSIVFLSNDNPISDYAYIEYQSRFNDVNESGLLTIGCLNDGGGNDNIAIMAGGGGGVKGYVGIGTTTPSELLTVQSAPDTDATFSVTTQDEHQDAILYLGTPNEPGDAKKCAIIAEGLTNWSRSDLHFCLNPSVNDNNTATANATLAHSKMVIQNDGNVGIGTTTPTHQLDVNGALKLQSIPGNVSQGYEAIRFARNDNDIRYSSIYASAYHVSFNVHDNGPSPHTGEIEVMRLTTDRLTTPSTKGRVGIGTTDPIYTLDVSGEISSSEHLVKNGTYTVKHHRSDGNYPNLFERTTYDAETVLSNKDTFIYIKFSTSDKLFTHAIQPRPTQESDYLEFRLNDLDGNRPTDTDFGGQHSVVTMTTYSQYTNTDGDFTTRNIKIQKDYVIGDSTTTQFTPQLSIASGSADGNVVGIGLNVSGNGYTHRTLTTGSLYYKQTTSSSWDIVGYLGLAVTDPAANDADKYGITDGELEAQTHLAITNNGNVGIGTTSPSSAKLTVRKDGLNQVMQTWIGDLGTNNGRTLHILSPDTDDANAPFKFTTGNAITFRIDSIEALNINAAGNVGIGTNSPSHLLHLKSNIDATLFIEADADNTGGEDHLPMLLLHQDGGAFFHSFGGKETDPNNALKIETGRTTSGEKPSIVFLLNGSAGENSGTERMRIEPDGKVGIGTNDPTALLHLKSSGDVVLRLEADHENSGENDLPQLLMTQDGGLHFHSFSGVASSSGHSNDNSLRIETGSDTVGSDSGSNVGSICFATGGSSGFGSGTERMRIDETGNVGIGTDNPSAKLHVNGNIQCDGLIKLEAATADGSAQGRDNTYIAFGMAGTGSDWAFLRQIGGNNTYHMALDFHDDSDDGKFSIRRVSGSTFTSLFHIDSSSDGTGTNGYVGIGTDNPSAKLHVNGNIELGTSSESKIKNTVGNLTLEAEHAISLVMDNNGNNPTTVYVNVMNGSTELMKIKANGNVGIGTTNPEEVLHVNGNIRVHGDIIGQLHSSIEIQGRGNGNDTNGNVEGLILKNIKSDTGTPVTTSQIDVAYNGLYFHTNETERMRITSAGNVGIGTTVPSEKLEVHGNQIIRHGTTNSRGYVELKFNNNGLNQGSGAGLVLASNCPSGFIAEAIIDTWTSGASGNPPIYIKTRGTTRMTIQDGGNVGIGTDSPKEKLSVAGTVMGLGSEAFVLERDSSTFHNVNTPRRWTIGMDPSTDTNATPWPRYMDWFNLTYYTTNGTNIRALTITNGGSVGIGTHIPTEKLDVYGYCRAINFISTSDDRVKHNETPLTDSLGLISQLHPKRYLKTQQMYDASLNITIDESGNYTDISENDVVTEEIGIIAQDVLSIDDLSFLVKPSLDPSGNETGPMGLDYQSLFVLSIQAIQELKARIETLEAQVL